MAPALLRTLCIALAFVPHKEPLAQRIYDDRVGETQAFTRREEHEWYWFPQQRPEEIAFLKCYDSISDGEM